MSLFEFTSKTKSAVLQIDSENQIPINGFYLPVVIMPDNIKVDFRRLDNIDGLTKIKEINLNDDTVIINGVTFSGATAQDLYDSLESLFFLDESGGGGGTGVPITQRVGQFSSLSPGTSVGDLAYVENSEGTSWLPATMGGTYYPAGFYLWDGSAWTSDRNAISKQLADNILNISENSTEIDQEVIDRVTGDEGTVTIHSDISDAGSGEIITTAERTNLNNQSGTNTGDETTATIQTKRPLKTINNESIEGSGNLEIDSAETFYNTDKTLSGITRVVDFEDGSSLYFDYFDTNQSTYNIKRNFAINQFGVNISAGDGDGTGQSVGSNNINLSGTSININSTLSTFKGLEYSGDYSANYVDRSIVDKEFVINEIASSTSDNLYTADGEVSAVNRVSNWTNQCTLQFNVFDSSTTSFNNKSGLLIEDNNTTLKADVGDGAGNITSETFLKVESDVITIGSDLQNFNALQYDADYSTNFTDRTLVDKGYVDSKGASFYDQDGTIDGNRSVYLDNFGELEIFSFNGPIASNNGAGIFKLNYDSFEIGFVDTSSGTVENNIKYVPSVGFQLQDDSLQVGLRYFADYSANYGDRSLVDKEYVVNQIANIDSDFIPLPSEGTQNNERSIAILNSTGDDLEYTSDIKIDEASQQTFFKHGVQTSSAHEIVFRDSGDQDQFVINKDKEPGYLQTLSGNDLKLNDYTIPETGDSFSLPSSDGVNGSSLVTDGSGVLGFKELVKFPNETTGSESISIGTGSNDFATGENNIAIGESALSSLTSVFGSTNNAIGSFSQENNETGGENNSLGFNSLRGLITGSENTAVGHSALEGDLVNGFNGSNNTTLGAQSFGTIANTGNNLTSADNCVALGFDTRASADGVSNEVVIGASATGRGSNTVTLGADTNTQTFLTGEVNVNSEYSLPTTEGTEGQVLTADGVGGTSFEDASNGYTIFPIWAEDNSTLTNVGLEWSFGNGAKDNNQIPIPMDCELFAVTFHCATGTGTANIDIRKRVNGANVLVVQTDTFSGNEPITQVFNSPFPYLATESLAFLTRDVTGTYSNARVCAWLRVKATSQSTSLLGELLDVSLPSPTIGDVLSYDGTNWGAAPGATATIKTASFMSTVAQDVGTGTNGIGTNIQINMTNVLGPNSIGYGLSSGNITIPAAGWYKISLKSLTTTTTTGRQNTSFVVKRNSADIAGTKVAGYNRNTANNTASATLCPTIPQFQFAQGDTIGLYAISGGDNSQTSLTVSQECILTLELI